MPVEGLDALIRQLQALPEELREGHRAAQQRVALFVLDDVIQRSPVKTGAYRASHAVWSGGAEPAEQLFVDPAAPEPDQVVPFRGSVEFLPPDQGAAESAVEASRFGDALFVRNQRFYAEQLEYGSDTRAGQFIYELAIAHAEAASEREARAAERAILDRLART